MADRSDEESLKEYLPTKQDALRVSHHLATRDRFVFAFGFVLLGWAITVMVEGVYSLWLGVTVFLAGCIVHEIRLMPVSRDDARIVKFGEIGIVENVLYVAGLLVPAFIAANLADIRIVFSVLIFVPILGLYIGKLLPENFPYHRLKDVPVVNDAIVAFGAALFLVSSVLFFNQVPSSAGMVALIIFFVIQLFISFSLPDIGSEQEREEIFAVDRPPANLPEQVGSARTKKILLVLNAVSFALFAALIGVGALHPIAMFPLLTVLFGFVFIYFVDDKNVDRMTAMYWALTAYVFFLFTAIGWVSFAYGAV